MPIMNIQIVRRGRNIVMEYKKIDPTRMTTFKLDELDKAFEIMDKKLDGVIKPLIRF